MTEIDALRQERERFRGGSAAICVATARARSPVGRIERRPRPPHESSRMAGTGPPRGKKLDQHGARPQPSFSPSSSLYSAAPNTTNRSGQRRPIRHCEEPLRRSNPGATTCAAPATQTVVLRPLDCFASLAMTDRELAHLFLRVALVIRPRRRMMRQRLILAGHASKCARPPRLPRRNCSRSWKWRI